MRSQLGHLDALFKGIPTLTVIHVFKSTEGKLGQVGFLFAGSRNWDEASFLGGHLVGPQEVEPG